MALIQQFSRLQLPKFANFVKFQSLTNCRSVHTTYRDFVEQRSTIDNDEIRRFSKFGDIWWTGKAGAALRSMNELRVPLIRDNVMKTGLQSSTSNPLMNVKILDVGSGGGILSEPLARLGATVFGIDPVKENIAISEEHRDRVSPGLKSNLSYKLTSIENMLADSSNNDSYDAVVVSEVLEHVDNVELLLESSRSLLKPDGKLIITTINQTVSAVLLAIVAGEYLSNLVPQGTHSYDKLVPLNGLRAMLKDLKFSVDIVHGMCYNPISDQWSWITNTSVNYAVVATKV